MVNELKKERVISREIAIKIDDKLKEILIIQNLEFYSLMQLKYQINII